MMASLTAEVQGRTSTHTPARGAGTDPPSPEQRSLLLHKRLEKKATWGGRTLHWRETNL